MTATVPVYEWLTSVGRWYGIGTKVEFDYWIAEGVFPADLKLGAIQCHEPASEDDARRAAWKIAA